MVTPVSRQDKFRAVVNAVMNTGTSEKQNISRLSEKLIVFLKESSSWS
jgi:hypothetical protein